MLNSINTNIAAYSAQGNIGKASNSAASSISRLSSGNRIVKASDDVAALSIGTSLKTGVTTLKQALANTSQGTSLLQVADGALSQISDILQRQKAIATQANSGTLSDVERGYLNQEFQALSSQIDQIASSSSFSSVKLLDGTLSGSAKAITNVEDATSTSGATAAAIFTFATAVPANNDEITVNGVSIKFTTSAPGTVDAAGKVNVGNAVAETGANLVEFLNKSTDPRLANLYFTNSGAAVSANWAGGALTSAYVVDAALVTGTTANFGVGTTANRTIATTNPADGLGVDRTRAIGQFSGSILAYGGNATVNAGSAITTRTIEDNEFFVGKVGGDNISKFQVTYTASDTVVISLQVGNITYSSAATDITNAAQVAITLTGQDEYNVAKGGTFVLNLKGAAFAASSIAGQADANEVANQLNDSFKNVTFVQNRDVTTFQEGDIISLNGVEVANLDGVSANLRSDNFSTVNIESIKIYAPEIGSTDAKFEVQINGETYISTSGIGNQIGTAKAVALQSTTNPNNVFSLVMGGTSITSATLTSMDLSTQAKADAVAKGLADAFGLTGGSRLNFQVGSSASDTIGVKINSVATSNLFNGATLDVTTLAGAQAAGVALDSAIANINSVRANVGALQSRLDYTAANLQSSIQNQDAARGTLLDTDVAAESTAYATAQVQLQAGIAVLAQANQIPQNLLKLIS